MQVILDIKDSRVPFFMELIRSLSFVKLHNESSKDKIVRSIRKGLKEVELVENGKLKSRSAKAFLNEL